MNDSLRITVHVRGIVLYVTTSTVCVGETPLRFIIGVSTASLYANTFSLIIQRLWELFVLCRRCRHIFIKVCFLSVFNFKVH